MNLYVQLTAKSCSILFVIETAFAASIGAIAREKTASRGIKICPEAKLTFWSFLLPVVEHWYAWGSPLIQILQKSKKKKTLFVYVIKCYHIRPQF